MQTTKRRQSEVALSDCQHNEQLAVLAQLTRNQFAIDYWTGHLATVCELPIYRREIKQLYNRIQREAAIYNGSVHALFHKKHGELDAYEILLDTSSEFYQEVKRMVYLYEQAMSRVIQRKGLPEADFLCRMSTAQQLINACAYACGIEAMNLPQLKGLLTVGTSCMEMPFRMDEGERMIPSAMGHFSRMSGRMNLLMLEALGQHGDIQITEEEDPEVIRSVNICAQNIIHSMMNYELISAMYEDTGHTLEEAREIVAQRKEKAKQDNIKAEEKKRLKEAKKQYKQTKSKDNEI